MNLTESILAASDAWALLAEYPLRWTALIVAFLLIVEALTFIPYIGFVVKLAVASIVVPQVITMFAAASEGHAPSPAGMFGALSLSPSTMAVLMGAALLPFTLGIIFLYLKGGSQAIEFFFGNMFKSKPPSAALFEQFKYVMQFAAVPFSLLAGAVAIKGLAGPAALSAALIAAITNWVPVVLLLLLSLAFEWSSAQLAAVLPKPAAVAVGITLLVAYLAWSFALTYTISARVFDQTAVLE